MAGAVDAPVAVDPQRAARALAAGLTVDGRVAAQVGGRSDTSRGAAASRSSGSRPERTALDERVAHRYDRLVEEVMAEAQRVGAGRDRTNRAFLHPHRRR